MAAVPAPLPSFVIRPAVAADFGAYMDAFESVAAEGRWMGAEAPIDRAGRRAGFERAVAGEGATAFLADAGGSIVGAIYGTISGGIADFGMFVVAGYRAAGIGRALLEAIIDWARAGGAHKISLAAWPTNHAAIGLYARYGFRVEGTRRRHYRRRSGALWDSVSMGLVLDEESPGGPGARKPAATAIVIPYGGIRCAAGGLLPSEIGGRPAGEAADRLGADAGGGADGAGDVVLRPWRRADAPSIVALLDDAEIHRWLPLPDPYTPEDAEEYIAGAAVGLTARTGAALAIVVDGAVAGSVGLRIDPTDAAMAEIGYWVGAPARGRGVATAAARALSDFGFESLGLRRIELNAAVENLASRRVAERAGFAPEGIRRAWREIGGVPVDFAVHGRVRPPT